MYPTTTLHILVIEDDADTRANLRDILELDDHRVELAGSAAEVLAREDWSQIAAVILDRRLPDATADELLPRIRHEAPDAAVIIVTGYADLQGAVSALRQGATDYVLKPIEPDDLRARLRRIGERRQAGDELKRQAEIIRSLLANASDAIIVADSHGKVQLYNPAAERLIGPMWIGAPPEQWLQQGRAYRTDGDTAYAVRDLPLARALSGEHVIDEEILLREPDARSGRWVSVNASPIRDGGHVKEAVVIYRDINARKRAEERALQAERLATIGQMVTGLAHESRNALQRGQACLEMLALQVRDRPEALGLISRLQKAQDDLHHLYEDVRGYAAPIRLERRRYDLATIWRKAWADLEPQRKGRSTSLRERLVEPEVTCDVDPFRLGQVFHNVLENALAACPDPVEIEVCCTPAEIDGRGALRVVVRDNGPGFGPEDRRRIFEPFYTTKTRGTGLGLAIARRIVEAHGGRIAAGEGPTPGAEIVITLPRGEP
jgi:two-component system sensor kinase FixL